MSHKGVGFYNINDECDVNAPEATPRKYSKETKKERKKGGCKKLCQIWKIISWICYCLHLNFFIQNLAVTLVWEGNYLCKKVIFVILSYLSKNIEFCATAFCNKTAVLCKNSRIYSKIIAFSVTFAVFSKKVRHSL